MRIAIASGREGTGKTTIAVNLVQAAAEKGTATYVDCDVEGPDGHLFLRPAIASSTDCSIAAPVVDEQRCTACGRCARLCQYGAIVCAGKDVLTYPELCHGCGGCTIVCPPKAITERPHHIGVVERGTVASGGFVQGRLDVGQTMSPPLIRAVLEEAADHDGGDSVVDVPPGTSCPAVTAVARCDYVVLVTQPTPSGLDGLAPALATIAALHLPAAVVVNRHREGNDLARRFCAQRGVPILAELPDDRRVAEACSRGMRAFEAVEGYAARIRALWQAVQHAARTREGRAA